LKTHPSELVLFHDSPLESLLPTLICDVFSLLILTYLIELTVLRLSLSTFTPCLSFLQLGTNDQHVLQLLASPPISLAQASFNQEGMTSMSLDCLHHLLPTLFEILSTWSPWPICLFDYSHLVWHVTSTTPNLFSSIGSKLSFNLITLLNMSPGLSYSSTNRFLQSPHLIHSSWIELLFDPISLHNMSP